MNEILHWWSNSSTESSKLMVIHSDEQ
jgi:hypothetical protein